MTDLASPRSLDHLVLPVEDIQQARKRYKLLGFTVAPDGHHPFGTENCCIFLADGTFLEPLGIAQRETCEAWAKRGHAFIANDQAFRFRRGAEGFSHMVLKSNDAKADHRLFKSNGISAGELVRFSRESRDREGNASQTSFALAFAADRRSPDSGFFTCQVTTPAKIDRSALQTHENGALALKEVILSEVNPTDFQYFFQDLLNQREMDVDSFGMSFDVNGAKVSVLTPDGMQAFYGIDCFRAERGMHFEAAILQVKDLEHTKNLLAANEIDFVDRPGRLLVGPAAGQATTLILEETSS
ncbi:MAG: VOC family protein [Rhizobiaceae bacterium]